MTIDERSKIWHMQFRKTWESQTLKYIATINEGGAPKNGIPSSNSFHLSWDKIDYYVWAVDYISAKQDREYDQAISAKRKSITIPGGGICAVFMHDKDLNPVTSVKIDLPENNYGTWCNGTYALGGAGKGIDGYLTDGKRAQKPDEIGQNWYHMTVLLRLQKSADGKVTLVQDDRCLGNPNRYADIPSARKALSKCQPSNMTSK